MAIQQTDYRARTQGDGDTLLRLEHPPVLTLGRNANRSNIWQAMSARKNGVELPRGQPRLETFYLPRQVSCRIFHSRLRGDPSRKERPVPGPGDYVRLLEEALIRPAATSA